MQANHTLLNKSHSEIMKKKIFTENLLYISRIMAQCSERRLHNQGLVSVVGSTPNCIHSHEFDSLASKLYTAFAK